MAIDRIDDDIAREEQFACDREQFGSLMKYFRNDPQEVEINGLENNCIIKVAPNLFHFKDPQKRGIGYYYANFLIFENFIIVRGNIPGDVYIINCEGDPLGFLRVCAHWEYLKSHCLGPQHLINERSNHYELVLPVVQAFYKAFINSKQKLDSLVAI